MRGVLLVCERERQSLPPPARRSASPALVAPRRNTPGIPSGLRPGRLASRRAGLGPGFLLTLCVGAGLGGWGCIDDVRVCEIVPEENTCSEDADCVLGYCATDCCYCPNAVAVRQLEATWCLTRQGETPFTDCLRGREERCRDHPPCVCAYDVEPWCNAGRCDLRPAP